MFIFWTTKHDFCIFIQNFGNILKHFWNIKTIFVDKKKSQPYHQSLWFVHYDVFWSWACSTSPCHPHNTLSANDNKEKVLRVSRFPEKYTKLHECYLKKTILGASWNKRHFTFNIYSHFKSFCCHSSHRKLRNNECRRLISCRLPDPDVLTHSLK